MVVSDLLGTNRSNAVVDVEEWTLANAESYTKSSQSVQNIDPDFESAPVVI